VTLFLSGYQYSSGKSHLHRASMLNHHKRNHKKVWGLGL
jgi:hypothetical protein